MSLPISDLTITQVVTVLRINRSPIGVITPQKNRKRWGIAWKTAGRTVYTCQGTEYLSDARHPVLLPGGSTYTWTCTDPGECLLIEFEAAETGVFVESFSGMDVSFVKNVYTRLQTVLRSAGPAGAAEAKSLVYGLLAEMFRSRAAGKKPTAQEILLRPAFDCMAEHFDDPALTNDRLAALCGVSTAYFRKQFRELTGISPIRRLHDLRMARAKAMLQSDYGSVGLVAESVGYSSIYHFSKMFRAYTGMSPTEYARRY